MGLLEISRFGWLTDSVSDCLTSTRRGKSAGQSINLSSRHAIRNRLFRKLSLICRSLPYSPLCADHACLARWVWEVLWCFDWLKLIMFHISFMLSHSPLSPTSRFIRKSICGVCVCASFSQGLTSYVATWEPFTNIRFLPLYDRAKWSNMRDLKLGRYIRW